MLVREKATKVMRRVWSQPERKLDEMKLGKEGVSASQPPMLFYPGLISTGSVYSASNTSLFFHLCPIGSVPRLENEGLRKLGLENGPEALFHRLPSFHYDDACPQQTELFSVHVLCTMN